MYFCLTILLLITPVGFIGCSKPIEHNEKLAGKRALEFAEITLIKQNFDEGYALLASKARSYVPVETFKKTVSRLHPDGYPSTLIVTKFEPMLDEKALYVYLRGENSGREFHYTLTLNGTAASDYQVSVIDRTR